LYQLTYSRDPAKSTRDVMNDAFEFFLNEISYSFALNFIGILNVLSNYDTGLKSNIQYEL